MAELNSQLRKQFVRHLYSKMKQQLSGSHLDRVYGDKPQMRFFVGTLCSQDPSKSLGSVQTKVAPINIGAEFLLNKKDIDKAELKIKPKASVFYQVNPTYQEQIKSACDELKLNEKELLEKINKSELEIGVRFLSVFKKYKLKEIELKCKLSDFIDKNYEGQMELSNVKEIISDAFEKYDLDNDIYRPKKLKKEEMNTRILLSHLKDTKSFKEFLNSWGQKDIRPSWSCKVLVNVSDFDSDHVKVSTVFENTSVAKENDHIDNFLFDVSLDIGVSGSRIQDFIIEYLNDHYKYDGNIEVSGINCEAKKDSQNNRVFTEHMPYFEQFRLKTNDAIKPYFKDLSSDLCISHLEKISEAMKIYLKEYDKKAEKLPLKSEIGKARFKKEKEVFENEIKRFDEGIDILRKYPMALKAFKLMNKTFLNASESKASGKTYTSWRAFQIIFIVMNLADIVSTEYNEINSHFERVEVLYFPTGGGKTETYLGLSIFTLFFDRLRGKKFGVSIITKFPLRLLSLQQLQRIANILAQAELIRRVDLDPKDSEEFSLGYFVGKENTPNTLIKKVYGSGEEINILTPIADECEKIRNGELKLDDEELEGRKYLIISKCPFCGSDKIMVDADVSKIRLLHRCMNEECEEDILPIYVSDMEVYRYVPSFIVSTLDKIAICGWQKNFKNLFGQVTHKCPLHGYTSSKECTEKDLCKVEKEKIIPIKLYDPVPTLQIQDEMHLIRESLGTFDSHYESFLEHLEKELTLGRRSMKILTATATISDYKMQTDHLYCKDAMQYPSQGPSISESFYSTVDKEDLNRLIVGISPHNSTMIYSILSVIENYHTLINTYYNNPVLLIEELKLDLTDLQVKEMVESYMVKLSYHLAKNDGDSISNSIRTMINRGFKDKNIKEIVQRPLTGDVSFNDVRIALDNLENPEKFGADIDLIIATSMISHGVDIDKLNFMTFMGMPNNTAEYIQSSSRVGRAYPGIVFVIFNATRERDQSYFKFFTKFHEYKDLLVEAVPINRWAKFGINRTFPGIFIAAILNYFDSITMPKLEKSINMTKMFEKAINEKYITEDQILDFMLKSYKTDKDKIGFGFEDFIRKKTQSYIDELISKLGNEFIGNALPEKPMNSLRDVDKLIPINLSTDGMMILRNIKAARTLFYEDEDSKVSDVEEELE